MFAVDGRPDLSMVVYNPATPADAARIKSLMDAQSSGWRIEAACSVRPFEVFAPLLLASICHLAISIECLLKRLQKIKIH